MSVRQLSIGPKLVRLCMPILYKAGHTTLIPEAKMRHKCKDRSSDVMMAASKVQSNGLVLAAAQLIS